MEKIYHIKNMVCTRCIIVVRNIFENANFEIKALRLGEVVVEANAYSHSDEEVDMRLRQVGLEILETEEQILVEQIKTTIVQYIHEAEYLPKTKLSDYLSSSIELPYSALRKTFRTVTDTTIEKYFILQKVERTKELLQYNDLSVKEIAYKLGYSSLQHLSNQFKMVTGHSPKAYKENALNLRIPVDTVLSMAG